MSGFSETLTAEQRIVMAVDVPNLEAGAKSLAVAREAGATVAKLGLELISNTSPEAAADLALGAEIAWIADAKIDDIPNTTAGAIKAYAKLDYPPLGITVHTKSGIESMKAAQEIAGEHGIMIFGVTHLTSIGEEETQRVYGKSVQELVLNLARTAFEAGVEGLVCAAPDLAVVKADPETGLLFTMIPGTRSAGADTNDQKRVMTPGEAMEIGADLLVGGRQITAAENPADAYFAMALEMQEGMDRKAVA